ncbi:unnamed protein product [Natator depressus]
MGAPAGNTGTHLLINCSYTSAQQVDLLHNYTNVMFASNPLEQLVSAHREKHLHSEPFCSVILANKRRATFRENNNATEKVSFQEVVNFILKKPKEQNKANKKTHPNNKHPPSPPPEGHLDIHWNVSTL